MEELIKSKVREVPDWPKKGVNFKDFTPLLEDAQAFRKIIDKLAEPYLNEKIDPVRDSENKKEIFKNNKISNGVDKIIGIDARGFLLASALAYKLGTGIAIIRKKGKLPPEVISREYALEYGTDAIEMRKDSIIAGEIVLLVDDVLATGETMKSALSLMEELKADVISVDFLIELTFLNGREKLKRYNLRSLAKYDS